MTKKRQSRKDKDICYCHHLLGKWKEVNEDIFDECTADSKTRTAVMQKEKIKFLRCGITE